MLDAFTNRVLLQSIRATGHEQAYAMYKEIKATPHETLETWQRTYVESKRNCTCTIVGTSYSGRVVGLNPADGGMYGNFRYPFLVDVGIEVFEYGLTQVRFPVSSIEEILQDPYGYLPFGSENAYKLLSGTYGAMSSDDAIAKSNKDEDQSLLTYAEYLMQLETAIQEG